MNMIAMTKNILFQGGLSPGLSHRKNPDNPIGDQQPNLFKNHSQSLTHTSKSVEIKPKYKAAGSLLQEIPEGCVMIWINVVYFDQRTGAPHAIRWSKSFFWR